MDQNSANVTVCNCNLLLNNLNGRGKSAGLFFYIYIHRPVIILFLRPDYHISMYFLSSVCGES